jgi:hypothetical protein
VPVNRVERLIINLDTAMPVVCGWDTCDRRARTSHQVRTHEHPGHVSCSDVNQAYGTLGRHVIYAFCSAGHLDYWVSASGWRAHELADANRGLIYGQHSAGNKMINR